MTQADEPTAAGYSRAEAATRPLERSARIGQRPAPPPPTRIPPRPSSVRRRSAPARMARFLTGLLALVLIAAMVAAAVIALTDDQATVRAREWTSQSIEELSTELKDYVREHTQ
jgi:ferric-dicitrate binding protein FerR (iron transport regulator)